MTLFSGFPDDFAPNPVSKKDREMQRRASAEQDRLAAIRGKTPDVNAYEISSLTYPKDLMEPDYGGNYAMFFINIQSASKLQELNGVPGLLGFNQGVVNNAATGINSVVGKVSSGAAATYEFGVGAVQGIAAAGGLAWSRSNSYGGYNPSLWDMVKSNVAKVGLAGVGVGAIRAAATGVIANESGGFSLPVKRLKTAIALHMPLSLSIRYSMNYEESDIPFGLIATNALFNNTDTDLGAGATAGALRAGGDGAGAISKLSKLAINPAKEQIFKGVEFRTFNFTYLFAPRNPPEASNVLEIINQFKFHMHPEFKDEDQFLYIYPSEFDIVYYANGKENNKVHRHTSCVLTDLSVNYSPNGIYTTFANGMPTQIEINLTFKELAKLDREKIKEGKF